MKTLHQKFNGDFEKKEYKRPQIKWAKTVVDKTDFVPDIKKQFNLGIGSGAIGIYDTDFDPKLQNDLSSYRNLNDITEIQENKKIIEQNSKQKIKKAEAEILQEATKQNLIKKLNSEAQSE